MEPQAEFLFFEVKAVCNRSSDFALLSLLSGVHLLIRQTFYNRTQCVWMFCVNFLSAVLDQS